MEKKKLYDLFEEVKLGEDYQFVKSTEDLDEDIVLEEGIKYFKASQRLNKLAEKLSRKDIKEMMPIVERVKRAAGEFERIEGKFERGEVTKGQARLRVDMIKRNYSDIIKMLRQKDMQNFFKVAGVTALLGGIVASILFGFQPLAAVGITIPSWEKIKNTLGMLGGEVAKQFNALKKAFTNKVSHTPLLHA